LVGTRLVTRYFPSLFTMAVIATSWRSFDSMAYILALSDTA
jgi:hypothetical protein